MGTKDSNRIVCGTFSTELEVGNLAGIGNYSYSLYRWKSRSVCSPSPFSSSVTSTSWCGLFEAIQTSSTTQIPRSIPIHDSRDQRCRRSKLDSNLPSVCWHRPLHSSLTSNWWRISVVTNRAQAFIDGALGMGGKVLVHCGDGISRSPAIVCVVCSTYLTSDERELIRQSQASHSTAYIMMKTSLNHEDAFAFVQARRFCVAPRGEFVHQLEVRVSLFLTSPHFLTDRFPPLSLRK